ncbi:MAG: hypothetical protein GHHEDOFH_03037 [Pseudorhodoplanes sp.]|nr:hypothetical protein [Pseudorhodoplanes sp.]
MPVLNAILGFARRLIGRLIRAGDLRPRSDAEPTNGAGAGASEQSLSNNKARDSVGAVVRAVFPNRRFS